MEWVQTLNSTLIVLVYIPIKLILVGNWNLETHLKLYYTLIKINKIVFGHKLSNTSYSNEL